MNHEEGRREKWIDPGKKRKNERGKDRQACMQAGMRWGEEESKTKRVKRKSA